MPKADRMEGGPEHFAVGYTSDSAEAFQGRKNPWLFLHFDEAVKIGHEYWIAAEGMLTGADNRWLATLNPTDPGSAAYAQEESGRWRVFAMDVREHPNVLAGLEGRAEPFPGATTLGWLEDKVRLWSAPVIGAVSNRSSLAFEWPPGGGLWHEPKVEFETKVMGRWPSQSAYGVWPIAAFDRACGMEVPELPMNVIPEIGCDVARFGDDETCIVVRVGSVAVYYEGVTGQALNVTADRLRWLCDEWGSKCGVGPERVLVKIDVDGVGGGVVDQAKGYNFIGISAASAAVGDFHNRRSELWFGAVEAALAGRMYLGRLEPEVRRILRLQAMAPRYKLDGSGFREVEGKEITKKRLRRSPDGMDALNLCWAQGMGYGITLIKRTDPAADENRRSARGVVPAGAPRGKW